MSAETLVLSSAGPRSQRRATIELGREEYWP